MKKPIFEYIPVGQPHAIVGQAPQRGERGENPHNCQSCEDNGSLFAKWTFLEIHVLSVRPLPSSVRHPNVGRGGGILTIVRVVRKMVTFCKMTIFGNSRSVGQAHPIVGEALQRGEKGGNAHIWTVVRKREHFELIFKKAAVAARCRARWHTLVHVAVHVGTRCGNGGWNFHSLMREWKFPLEGDFHSLMRGKFFPSRGENLFPHEGEIFDL